MNSQSYDLESIRNFTRLKASEENSLIKFYSQLSTESRIKFMDRAYTRFKNVTNRHIHWKNKFAELQYATFLMELAEYKRNEKLIHKKSINGTQSNPEGIIDKTVAGSIKTPGKASKARRFISLKAYSVIKELRNEGEGWRFIQKYLKKKYRKDISHTYLARIWKELHSE